MSDNSGVPQNLRSMVADLEARILHEACLILRESDQDVVIRITGRLCAAISQEPCSRADGFTAFAFLLRQLLKQEPEVTERRLMGARIVALACAPDGELGSEGTMH